VEPTNERLHIGNLDYDVTEADLYDLFNGVGSVRDAEIVYHKYTQRSKGFAFVVMASVEEAKRAFELLNGKEFMGRPMWVNGAKSAGPVESEGEPEAAPSSTAA
jgi:RNA recognition motif-containing protein